MITTLLRKVLVVEEGFEAGSLLVRALAVLIGDSTEDRVLDAVKLVLETRLALLRTSLVLDRVTSACTLLDIALLALGLSLLYGVRRESRVE